LIASIAEFKASLASVTVTEERRVLAFSSSEAILTLRDLVVLSIVAVEVAMISTSAPSFLVSGTVLAPIAACSSETQEPL